MKTEGNIVTVVTCTYNRSKLIGSLYDSLLKQTDKNFKWLVIDDGSSDDTCQLIDKFIDENQIEIDYIYKTNGGKHTALNYAFENIDTELLQQYEKNKYPVGFTLRTPFIRSV